MADSGEKPTFRKGKKKQNARQAEIQADNDNEEELEDVQKIIEKQKNREVKRGITDLECAVGDEKAKQYKTIGYDPLSYSSAMISDEKRNQLTMLEIKNNLSSKFVSAEDEEVITVEMTKADEKRKRRALLNLEDEPEEVKRSTTTFEDELFYKAAEKMASICTEITSKETAVEMEIGIPEVDVGFENKVKRIVELEERKKKMMKKN
uniref:DUF2040 domain-containing protein n=1 Tax=Rhabditophanes sp. KR3021 TaxID=114890 RepID=A0AC35UAE0_9BILA